MSDEKLKELLTTIPLSISSSRRSGTNGLQNVDEVIEALRPFLAQPVSVGVGARAIMISDCCGVSLNFERFLCDDAALDPSIRRGSCHCKQLAKACYEAAGLQTGE